jgi:hypothetical protein
MTDLSEEEEEEVVVVVVRCSVYILAGSSISTPSSCRSGESFTYGKAFKQSNIINSS